MSIYRTSGGKLNAESRLVLNEYSLKRLMLELCAGAEKQTCKKGEESSSNKLTLRVLCPNISEPEAPTTASVVVFPPAGDATRVNTMG